MHLSPALRLRILAVAALLFCALALSAQPPLPVSAWGSFREPLVNFNTHAEISALAWEYLSQDISPYNYPNFPSLSEIIAQDVRTINLSGPSTSPDHETAEGPVTQFSGHYRQNGPVWGQVYYLELVEGLKKGSVEAARDAAWLAHFTGDLYVPWHTRCILYMGQTAAKLDDPNVDDDPQAFIDQRLVFTNGNLDCYESTYWDGDVHGNLDSTHILWEIDVADPDDITQVEYDYLWDNRVPYESRVQRFLEKVSTETANEFDYWVTRGDERVYHAVGGVASAWRGSLHTLGTDLEVAGSGSDTDTFKVFLTVENRDRQHSIANVYATITLPPGLSLVGSSQTIQVAPELEPGGFSYPATSWEVSGQTSTCEPINVVVSGQLPPNEPDLGVVEDQVYAPPIVRITSPAQATETGSTKVTITGRINDPSTRAWIDVNGTDRFWISELWEAGTEFSKEVELRAGPNTITAHAVNRCGKASSDSLLVIGNFEEPAIKVVMSWNSSGTDVDLHLTDSNGGSECYYANKNPEWGDPSSDRDDPLLDIDNTWSYGPETIILTDPKPGSYTARVVYYSDGKSDGPNPSFVTVKAYEKGELKYQNARWLENTADYWNDIYTFQVSANGQLAFASKPQAPTSSLGWIEKRLTNQPDIQIHPLISGNLVTWIDYRHANHQQIYRYDLASGVESRLSSVGLEEQPTDPSINEVILQRGQAQSGQAVVWADNRSYQESIYRLDASGETKLFDLTTLGSSPLSLDGYRLVWEDRRNGNADIYLYDLAGSGEQRITSDTAGQHAPAISGSFIVWTDERKGDYTIMMYDLSTAIETPIATSSTGRFNPPSISGNYVVWADGRNGNSDIYLYDLTTREEMQITSNPGEQIDPAVSGSRIVWVDYRNGNPDIYTYDLQTKAEIAVCTAAGDQREPDVDGQRIVWTDYRHGKPEIYSAEPGGTAGQGIFLPVVCQKCGAPPAGPGISGLATYAGTPRPGLSLALQYYDGSTWSTRATTTTGSDGRYAFAGAPALSPGQSYYVSYLNTAGAPNPSPGYLTAWYGNKITAYSAGSDTAGGDFDVFDVALVSPADNASVALPATFCWTRRNISGDNYWLAFYNATRQATATTPYLGDTACVEVQSLPASWLPSDSLSWHVGVSLGSNPDASPYNYGYSYSSRKLAGSWQSIRKDLNVVLSNRGELARPGP